MNARRAVTWLIAAGAVLWAGSVPAQALLTPSAVNLFRHMDMNAYAKTGVLALDSTAQWVTYRDGAWVTLGAATSAIDGGAIHAQYDFSTSSDYATNAVSLRLALAGQQDISTLTQVMMDTPTSYRVWAFNDPGAPETWTLLTGSTENPGGWQAGTSTINTNVNGEFQYVQIDYVGMQNWYIRVHEVVARPMANAQIGLFSGYNLMSYRPADGGPGPVPSYEPNSTRDPLYVSGWRSWTAYNPNAVLDPYDVMSYLVQETESLTGPAVDNLNYFVLPLNDLYTLAGFAACMYPDQRWTDLFVWYTDDETIDEDTEWKLAYQHKGTLGGSPIIAFDKPIQARYVKVEAPHRTDGGNGAMCEFELFATQIPEPATMSLLALGGLAMLRRRAWR